MKLLESRETLLEKVFEEARAKIGQSTSDKGKYQDLLKGLILQVSTPTHYASAAELPVEVRG